MCTLIDELLDEAYVNLIGTSRLSKGIDYQLPYG
jgi:hypothetical protein